jgi:hypothetical protein
MRNATCARTETSKLPTYVALLYGSLFYGFVIQGVPKNPKTIEIPYC